MGLTCADCGSEAEGSGPLCPACHESRHRGLAEVARMLDWLGRPAGWPRLVWPGLDDDEAS